MPDTASPLVTLRRPLLLIRAARHGLDSYNRARHLGRTLRRDVLPEPGAALGDLIAAEAEVEETRRAGDAAYSAGRHIDLLVALMAEARCLEPPVRRVRPSASQ